MEESTYFSEESFEGGHKLHCSHSTISYQILEQFRGLILDRACFRLTQFCSMSFDPSYIEHPSP